MTTPRNYIHQLRTKLDTAERALDAKQVADEAPGTELGVLLANMVGEADQLVSIAKYGEMEVSNA